MEWMFAGIIAFIISMMLHFLIFFNIAIIKNPTSKRISISAKHKNVALTIGFLIPLAEMKSWIPVDLIYPYTFLAFLTWVVTSIWVIAICQKHHGSLFGRHAEHARENNKFAVRHTIMCLIMLVILLASLEAIIDMMGYFLTHVIGLPEGKS